MELGATKEEAYALATKLDPDQNGYIEFKDFAQKMTPNLPHLLGTKEEASQDNLKLGGAVAPNSQLLKKQDYLTKLAAKTYRKIDEGLRPREYRLSKYES